MDRRVKQEPSDVIALLAKNVRRKGTIDLMHVGAVVKKEIKEEPQKIEAMKIQLRNLRSTAKSKRTNPRGIHNIHFHHMDDAASTIDPDAMNEFILLTDEAVSGPLTDARIKKILKTEAEPFVKEEIVDYKDADISANTGHGNSLPKVEDDYKFDEIEFKEEFYDYEEPNDAPTTSKKTHIPITQEIRKEFKCHQCGVIFTFQKQLDSHYESCRHIPYFNPILSNTRPPVRVWDSKAPMKDAREETTWRGHTMSEGCNFTAAECSLVKDDGVCKALYMDCEECGDRFGSVKDHRMHVLKEHPDSRDERLCKNKDCVRMREKKSQGFVRNKLSIAARESILKSMFESVNCPICSATGTTFTSYHRLFMHYRRSHSLAFNLKFLCRACDIMFDTPTLLQSHILQKAGENEKSLCIGASGVLRWPKFVSER